MVVWGSSDRESGLLHGVLWLDCNLHGINTRRQAGSYGQFWMDGWKNTAVRLVGLTELVGSADREPAYLVRTFVFQAHSHPGCVTNFLSLSIIFLLTLLPITRR